MTKTQEKAYKRVIENKASEAELKTLIVWADQEIEEWLIFREVCKSQVEK